MVIIRHDDAYYESRKPDRDFGPLGNCLRFVWNSDRKTLFGRTGKEWGEVMVFYVVFLSILGSLFVLQMWLTIRYISDLDRPYFQYETRGRSLFKLSGRGHRSPRHLGSPGVAYKPNTAVPMTSPIIWINNSSDIPRSRRYIRSLTDFLREYNKNSSDYDTNCNEDNARFDYNKPCFFDKRSLGACSKPPYGYRDPLQPCVFLQFNKKFDWIPNYYNRSSALPKMMPYFLKAMVKESKEFRVWLSCDGANNVDKDHIGEIEYIPAPGFPIQFFPFTGRPDYMSPLVALKFKNLTPKRLITVECTLWAFNIDYHSHEFLEFQILIGKFRRYLALLRQHSDLNGCSLRLFVDT